MTTLSAEKMITQKTKKKGINYNRLMMERGKNGNLVWMFVVDVLPGRGKKSFNLNLYSPYVKLM